MDYNDLESTLQMHRNKPAIIVSNFGTTMTESKDNIATIKGILKKLAIQDHFIHCDAALSGAYGNFINPRIPFDLNDGADSISVSGHKFIGSPMPSGVLLTKRSLRDRIAKRIDVVDSLDSTIAGSRNGHTSLFLWYAIKSMGVEGLKQRYEHCLAISDYCLEKIQGLGITVDTISHVVCMPNLKKENIDEFINDLKLDIKDKENVLSSLVLK